MQRWSRERRIKLSRATSLRNSNSDFSFYKYLGPKLLNFNDHTNTGIFSKTLLSLTPGHLNEAKNHCQQIAFKLNVNVTPSRVDRVNSSTEEEQA